MMREISVQLSAISFQLSALTRPQKRISRQTRPKTGAELTADG